MPQKHAHNQMANDNFKDELWEHTGQVSISTQIEKRKWGWISHCPTLRKPQPNITKHSLGLNPLAQGKGRPSRPKHTWRRSIKLEVKASAFTWLVLERAAQNLSALEEAPCSLRRFIGVSQVKSQIRPSLTFLFRFFSFEFTIADFPFAILFRSKRPFPPH